MAGKRGAPLSAGSTKMRIPGRVKISPATITHREVTIGQPVRTIATNHLFFRIFQQALTKLAFGRKNQKLTKPQKKPAFFCKGKFQFYFSSSFS
jgi:hypothetical protein